jgi:hypothetical protein
MRCKYSLFASFVLIAVGLLLVTGVSAWAANTFTVLHNFDNPGYGPIGNLIFDSTGNIYGTAAWGGLQSLNCRFACGVVFNFPHPAAFGTLKLFIVS